MTRSVVTNVRGTSGPVRSGSDEGAALVMALAFMLAWAIVVFAVIEVSAVGLTVSAGAQDRTDRIYAGDAALETVVAALANDDDPLAGNCPEPTLRFDGRDVTIACVLYSGPNVRVADLAAWVDGTETVRARVWFDDTASPAEVAVTNWMVVR